ncbi:MAG: hypothetical protein KF816_11510 [Melioribacteraceae bacterium]|jgi:hypothetical protein|nr:hypothetical protein [Melioribacteraceae bacterium]
MRIIQTLLVVLILISSTVLCQDVGKIFIEKDAIPLFGEVTAEQEIAVSDLSNFARNTEKGLSFGIINNQVYVLGDQRKQLSNNVKNISSETVVHFFSKKKVLEFLSLSSKTAVIKVQVRKTGVLTLSNGTYILEFAQPCPPYCG